MTAAVLSAYGGRETEATDPTPERTADPTSRVAPTSPATPSRDEAAILAADADRPAPEPPPTEATTMITPGAAAFTAPAVLLEQELALRLDEIDEVRSRTGARTGTR
jgi:hypothetical protein